MLHLHPYTSRATLYTVAVIPHYLLTRKQYRELTGCSRQALHNKIKRGTLKTVKTREEIVVEQIVLTPEEFQKIRPKMQAQSVDGVYAGE